MTNQLSGLSIATLNHLYQHGDPILKAQATAQLQALQLNRPRKPSK